MRRKKDRGRVPLLSLVCILACRDDSSDEQFMDAPVRGKFRVKCGRQQISLAHQDGEAFAPREYFDIMARLGKSRRPDKNHFERASGQGSRLGKNR